MKTKIALTKVLLITALIFTTLITVSNTLPSAPAAGEAEKTIRNYFRFPQVLLPHGECHGSKVQVLFTTDKSGKVNFVLAKTKDQVLKNEIERQFMNLHLQKLSQDVVHSVTLNFRTL